jgi:hypothetical protein
MFYETESVTGLRRYGLATTNHLLGPWSRVTDDFATGDQLRHAKLSDKWPEEVSHGEMIRSGYDQYLEYDPSDTKFLVQSMLASGHQGPYTDLPWKLGIIRKY